MSRRCCCGIDPCFFCETGTTPASFTCDFAAGGWTDSNCANCDLIVGEFILPKSDLAYPVNPIFDPSPASDCFWQFIDYNWCGDHVLSIALTLPNFGGSGTRYDLQIDLNDNAGSFAQDIHRSALTGSSAPGQFDCMDVFSVPRVLFGQTLGGACGGSLPANIDVWGNP